MRWTFVPGSFARQVRVAESRVVAVSNEVLLRFRPHQHPWRAEFDYQGAYERPRSLVGGRDGCAGRDGPRQFLDNESELVGSSKQPLQVEETAAGVTLAIWHDGRGPARHDGLSNTGWVDDHDVRVHRGHHAAGLQAPLTSFRPSDGTGVRLNPTTHDREPSGAEPGTLLSGAPHPPSPSSSRDRHRGVVQLDHAAARAWMRARCKAPPGPADFGTVRAPGNGAALGIAVLRRSSGSWRFRSGPTRGMGRIGRLGPCRLAEAPIHS